MRMADRYRQQQHQQQGEDNNQLDNKVFHGFLLVIYACPSRSTLMVLVRTRYNLYPLRCGRLTASNAPSLIQRLTVDCASTRNRLATSRTVSSSSSSCLT